MLFFLTIIIYKFERDLFSVLHNKGKAISVIRLCILVYKRRNENIS